MKKLMKSVLCIILCVIMAVPTVMFSSAAGLAKVSGLTYTSTVSTVTLSWKKVSGATSYGIFRYDNNKKVWTQYKTTTGIKYSISGLNSAQTYKYRVRAIKTDSKGKKTYGAFSDPVTALTLPGKPNSLWVTATTTNSITIKWTKVQRATGYTVYVYDAGAKIWKTVCSTSAVDCKMTGVVVGSAYQFKVRAYYKQGGVTKYGAYTSVVKAAAKPAQVTGLKLFSQTESSITLSWNKVNGATSYDIFRYTNGSWARFTTSKTNTATIKANATTYQYKVRAVVAVGGVTQNGAFSAVVKAAARPAPAPGSPEIPQNLKLGLDATGEKINITWSAVSNVDGYQIYLYDPANGKWNLMGSTTVTSFSYMPSSTATYYIAVKSFRKNGSQVTYSDYSSFASIDFAKKADDEALSDIERYGILGYMYSTDGYFYNTNDAIHRVAGFTPIYDAFAPFAICFYDTVRIFFTYNNLDWMVQLWKGQYGWTFIGGEIGVYTKSPDLNVAGYYFCATDENSLKMTMTVYNNGTELFTRPYGTYWWCTGYVFGMLPGAVVGRILGDADTSSLTMIARITLKDSKMTKAFTDGMTAAGFVKDKNFNVQGNDVIFVWN